jgi:hypothetical protein
LKQIEVRKLKKQRNEFVPEWKYLQTWINQRCWEDEEITNESKKEKYEPEKQRY